VAKPRRAREAARPHNFIKTKTYMKNIFTFALVASALILTSCGGGSVADKAADCFCETIGGIAKYKKEMEAAPEDKKGEIKAKMDAAGDLPCMKLIDAEVEKIDKDTSAAGKANSEAFAKDMKIAIEKKCGTTMKELNIPNM
jgi:hypothetical protein